ncbi:MAG: glycoside hydrolase family 15 protein, partial [Patescibacteria group bacterium]
NRFYLKEGEVFYISLFSLGKDQDFLHISLDECENELETARSFWEEWSSRGRCDLFGFDKAREAVERSAIVLKLLTFESTGTIAAAPTTSFACDIGGVRNWDYRFSWVRDSSFALSSFSLLGYKREAIDYINWILSVCVGPDGVDPKELKVLYNMAGEAGEGEELLDHLDGYCGSSPVRVGNSAGEQYQKDIYGSLLDLIWKADFLWGSKDISRSELWMLVSSFADFIASVWHEPDQSIWEFRMEPKHYVHSKVMSWVTLDRALKIAERYGYRGNIKYWKEEREAIREEVLKRGWSEEKSSFVQFFGSQEVDASLLVMSSVGFIDGKDQKMLSTIEAIEDELGEDDGLLLRYKNEDGLPGRDGAFLITSFWLVEALQLSGQKERAKKIYRDLISRSNHVGLLPEQIDPDSGDFLGNFPQGYSHIGVINSGVLLAGRSLE